MEVPATTQLLYYFTDIISLCLVIWVNYIKKKRKSTVLLQRLEGALLGAKRVEHLLLRCVDEGLWRVVSSLLGGSC